MTEAWLVAWWKFLVGASTVIGVPVTWLIRLWWVDRTSQMERLSAVEQATRDALFIHNAKERECEEHRKALDKMEESLKEIFRILRDMDRKIGYIEGRVGEGDKTHV